jgi:glycosyltransferase involved in cell wall biosynthesis
MKIALFSPLNPIRTGISDYTEEMLFQLAKYFDIDVYIGQGYTPTNKEIRSHFKIIPFDAQKFNPSEYDEIVYHIGNDYPNNRSAYEALKKYPGIVVLHDYVLQGFYAERFSETKDFNEYLQLLKKYYFKKGEEIARNVAEPMSAPIWETEESFEYPLNEEIVEYAKALIVHSNLVKERIQRVTKKPVVKINQHGYSVKTFDTDKVRSELGIDKEGILVLSTGFVSKNRRYNLILPTLSEMKNPKLKYVITGKDRGHILDDIMQDDYDHVILKGHLSLGKLEGLISASDICINLRYPTMGESSASLLRMMGYGKPILVTNFGSYTEIPDYCVIKINPDIDEKEMIKRFVNALISDVDFRLSVGREAREYVERECSIEKCTEEYARFIKEQ